MSATARLEVRVRPESKALIERAAALEAVPVSDFVRSAIVERAELVVADHEAHTKVPAEFFDDLLAALDAAPVPSDAVTRAARRARDIVTRT